jgi:SAM-dependent methyltransferase
VTEIANAEQYEAWNGEGGRRWVAQADRRDEVLAPVAEVLLDAAGLSAGETVIDVGCGVTTLAAARAVGPSGVAYGVDLSEPMLDVARQRAAAAGAQFDHESAMFGQSDPATVARTLQAAGYTDPQLQPVTLPLPIGADPDEALAYIAGVGLTRTALTALPADQQPAALDAIRAALSTHTTPDGAVPLDAGIYIVTAGAA